MALTSRPVYPSRGKKAINQQSRGHSSAGSARLCLDFGLIVQKSKNNLCNITIKGRELPEILWGSAINFWEKFSPGQDSGGSTGKCSSKGGGQGQWKRKRTCRCRRDGLPGGSEKTVFTKSFMRNMLYIYERCAILFHSGLPGTAAFFSGPSTARALRGTVYDAVMPFGAPVLSAPACEAPESGGPSGRFTAEEEAQVR